MNILLKQYQLFHHTNEFMEYVVTHSIMVYNKINNIIELTNAIKIPYMELEFKYENGLRFPYHNGNKINAIQIKEEEIYNYISCMSLISKNDIITGEKIQWIADVVISNYETLLLNPNNNKYSKQMKTMDELNDINDYSIIFVFTHNLNEFYHKFKNQLENKILITHNSDCEINTILPTKYHFAQNCLITHDKLYPIPIGIENNQWFDHDLFYEIHQHRTNKTKDIYFYFSLNTHPSRIDCYEKLKDKLEWNTKRNKQEYFIELAKHKYAICPRGNGLDTHRIWECLYLNVIPIIIKQDDLHIDHLPIIILNDWSEIDTIYEHTFKNQCIDKLRYDYYVNKIIDCTNDH